MGIGFFNKWLHLLSVMGVMGGLMFALVVLVPALRAASGAPEPSADLWKRWGISVGALWVVALATGFYNMILVTNGTPPVNGHYQMLLGMKMALAMLMFVLTLLVGHPMPATARFFQARSSWLVFLLILGIAVVGLSTRLNMSRVDRSAYHSTAPAVGATAAAEPARP